MFELRHSTAQHSHVIAAEMPHLYFTIGVKRGNGTELEEPRGVTDLAVGYIWCRRQAGSAVC